MRFALVLVLLVFAAPVVGQSADETARLEAFRARLAQVPVIPVERVELDFQPDPALGWVSAATADEEGRLYLFQRLAEGDPGTRADPITVFDSEGRFVHSWGGGLFNTPHGIRVDGAGDVWAVDANTSTVFKFSSAGDLLLKIQLDRPPFDEVFCGATDVAFFPDGHVVVSDGYCNGRVVEFDPDGNQVREWGTRGRGPGQFRVAHGIAVGPDEVIYVADRENGRLQRFDRSGRLLGMWEYASQLYSVAFSPDGHLYIAFRFDGGYADGPIVRIDPETGDMLGRIEIDCISHELAFAPDGALVPGLMCGEPTGRVVLYRPR